LAASSKVAGLPVVDDALRAGHLSCAQAVVVSDAAAVAPGAAARLVNDAHRSSLAELRQECLRTKAAADRDREATRARLHGERFLPTWTDSEGARHLHLRGPVDEVARIEARLHPFVDDQFNTARTPRAVAGTGGVRVRRLRAHDRQHRR
jgi:site-specific DNA-cytosine methylase